jgi:Protein of unknown function (DUF2442)
MTKDAGWEMPRRKPITEKTIDRAIASEAVRAANEHCARAAWYDRMHDAVILMLRDGRVFGAGRAGIPSLAEANPRQLRTLQVTEDGAFLLMPLLDLHISVDGLVTRLMEGSPAALRRSAAKSAGAATSPAKTAAARRNGRLGGRPRKAA